MQPVEFAISDSESARVTVTPYYAFRGQQRRSPLAPSATPYPARPGEGAATRMGRVPEEGLAMLREWRDRRTAELDASRRDAQFAEGDEILLDTEHNPPPPPPRV